MITANKKLREYMKQNNVPYWKLAAAFGVTEQTVIRWLRIELPSERTSEFMQKVDEIIKERED